MEYGYADDSVEQGGVDSRNYVRPGIMDPPLATGTGRPSGVRYIFSVSMPSRE